MKKRIYKAICMFLIVVLAFGCCTVLSYGKTKTVSMTVYDQCIKDGNTVYCATQAGIYKVNLKKGTRKRLGTRGSCFESYYGMKLHKGYLYYLHGGLEGEIGLERIKTSGKSRKELWYKEADIDNFKYAIKNKKIYFKYNEWNWSTEKDKTYKKKMKLNGKSKKSTSKNVKTKYAKTNKKGYKVIEKYTDDYSKYYLKTPKKTIFLTKLEQ